MLTRLDLRFPFNLKDGNFVVNKYKAKRWVICKTAEDVQNREPQCMTRSTLTFLAW